jgi:alpha-galactosidase
MSIRYDEEQQLFTLETVNSTYQMQVDEYGFLHHLYYGRRVGKANMNYISSSYDRGFSGNPYEARDRTYSLDTLAQEYTSFGVGDFRINGLSVINGDGSYGVDFRYIKHQIHEGKYSIPQMPAVYDNGGEAETLIISMMDPVTKLILRLYYGVFEEKDIITRSAEIINKGQETVKLEKVASMCLDMPFGKWDLVHFHGRHCMERQMERAPLIHSIQTIASKRGMSSHHHNPFVILCDRDAHEDFGDCYGMMFVYSGNHKTEIEVDQLENVRIVMGIHDAQFLWKLTPGDNFHTPEVIMTFSHQGFTKLSHNYHDIIRHNVCRGKYKLARRPILINNWEATYFDFDSEKLLKIAGQAADLGVELFVLDDGWFGNRNSDNEGLGDWFVNDKKLPGGLKPLADAVHDLGMKFGLWLEPEMVNENSRLYKEHPDWAFTSPNRLPMLGRNQLVLDMSRQDVVDYLYDAISRLLDENPIEYIKWDMNRSLSDVYSYQMPRERQGEVSHRYVLGVYSLMDRLTTKYPDVLFEGCSGGGGRFDPGILYYSPQIWCSDDTDPIERIKIQYGTSFGYPISTVGAHVSASPNHQTGRTTSLKTRGIVAMSGTFGYELDPNKLSEEEKQEIRQQIADFKKYYWLIQEGIYYRLTNPERGNFYDAWQFVAPDGGESLINMVVNSPQPNSMLIHLRLKGLDPLGIYVVEGQERKYSGSALMYGGYTFPLVSGDYPSMQIHLLRVGTLEEE